MSVLNYVIWVSFHRHLILKRESKKNLDKTSVCSTPLPSAVRISTDSSVVRLDVYFHLTVEDEETVFPLLTREKSHFLNLFQRYHQLFRQTVREYPTLSGWCSRSSPPRLPRGGALLLGQHNFEELLVLWAVSCVHKIIQSSSKRFLFCCCCLFFLTIFECFILLYHFYWNRCNVDCIFS